MDKLEACSIVFSFSVRVSVLFVKQQTHRRNHFTNQNQLNKHSTFRDNHSLLASLNGGVTKLNSLINAFKSLSTHDALFLW